MIITIRTNSDHPTFIKLVKLLDTDLAVRDGEDHAFYSQYNTITKINHVVLAYQDNLSVDNLSVGCGAIKEYTSDAMEVKRMFVVPEYRRKGVALQLLSELERWTSELNYFRCVLETGKRQPEAIALYIRDGYRQIPNYGQYLGIENSVCFEKVLK